MTFISCVYGMFHLVYSLEVASTSELHEHAGSQKPKWLTASKIKYEKFGPKIFYSSLKCDYIGFKNLNFGSQKLRQKT